MELRAGIEGSTFRHANVVRALAAAFHAKDREKPDFSPAVISAIKFRLKNFQAEGFGPPSQGQGREISYAFDDIMDWALGLTLQMLGMPTKVVLRNLSRGIYSNRLKKLFASKRATGKVYIIHFCSLLTEHIEDDPITWTIAPNELHRDNLLQSASEQEFDYAISNFTKTREDVRTELRRIIKAGIRP